MFNSSLSVFHILSVRERLSDNAERDGWVSAQKISYEVSNSMIQFQSQTFYKKEWRFLKEGRFLCGIWSTSNLKTVIRVTSCFKSSVQIAF